MSKRKPWVYVAGPLTQPAGHMVRNVRRACLAANEIRELDAVPLVPHLFIYDDAHHPRTYGFWLAEDLERLARCDAVFRFPGLSPGAEIEEKEADSLGIPVFRSLAKLADFLREWREANS